MRPRSFFTPGLPVVATATAARGGGFGALAAGVGVYFRIHDQHLHVPAAGQNVVQAAVADVVGPAVAAQNPHALADKFIRKGQEARVFRLAGDFLLEFFNVFTLLGDVCFILLRISQYPIHQFLAHGTGSFMKKLNGVFHLLVQGRRGSQDRIGVVFKQGELAQAGPRPSESWDHGVVGRLPP